jgi:hypothetical protein
VEGALDPARTGLVLEVSTGTKTMLLRMVIPGTAFRVSKRGTSFRYVPPRRRGARLLFRLAGTTADVLVSGLPLGPPLTAEPPVLRWVLRVGEECVRDVDLACRAAGTGTTCE